MFFHFVSPFLIRLFYLPFLIILYTQLSVLSRVFLNFF
nr:MAG TPA: hypothetical protein [Caudoviricetes sp.]